MKNGIFCIITYLIVLVFGNCIFVTNSFSQSVFLDTSFGNNGIVLTDINNSIDYGYTYCIQPDGKIIAGGRTKANSNYDILLIRYNPDGSIDNSFGNSGITITSIGSSTDVCSDLCLQADGRIIAAGYSYNGSNYDFAVLRYMPNGILDNTFGNSGIVTTDFNGNFNKATSVCLQSDGKIILAGYIDNDIDYDFAVARYNSNGTLDSTYGTNGLLTSTIFDSEETIFAAAKQTDNKIVIVGEFYDGFDYDFFVARTDTSGKLDSSFGSTGIVYYDFNGNDDEGLNLAIQPDNKIIFCGVGNASFFELIRLNTNGTIDVSFGYGGIDTLSTEIESVPNSIELQSDGKIIVGGNTFDGNITKFLLTRFHPNGGLDNSFGYNGRIITPVDSSASLEKLIYLPEGEIIAAGYSDNNTDEDIAIAKYYNKLTIITQPSNISICKNYDTLIYVSAIYCSGFQWQYLDGAIWVDIFDNAIFYGSSNDTLYLYNIPDSLNNFHYRCIVSEGLECDTSLVSTLTVIPSPDADAGPDIYFCVGQAGQLNASGGNYYSWTPTNGLSDANINNPFVDTLNSAIYYVTVTNMYGCNSIDSVYVFVQNVFQNENICIVSVDTNAWKNKVMWEKTYGVGTDYFKIFKETSYNVYDSIGNVDFDNNSFFIDYTSQPQSHGDKYKISIVDTCGNESDLSFYHKTMNLTISAFGSTMGLNWDDYVDESGLFHPAKYYIYRGTTPNDMNLRDSVSGSFTSYNDVNVNIIYYYMIGVVKDPPCNIIGSGFSYSNIKDNSALVNISGFTTVNNINVYPNPFTDYTTFEFSNPFNSNYLLIIRDITGREVMVFTTNTNKIIVERGKLGCGFYSFELKGDFVLNGNLIIRDEN